METYGNRVRNCHSGPRVRLAPADTPEDSADAAPHARYDHRLLAVPPRRDPVPPSFIRIRTSGGYKAGLLRLRVVPALSTESAEEHASHLI